MMRLYYYQLFLLVSALFYWLPLLRPPAPLLPSEVALVSPCVHPADVQVSLQYTCCILRHSVQTNHPLRFALELQYDPNIPLHCPDLSISTTQWPLEKRLLGYARRWGLNLRHFVQSLRCAVHSRSTPYVRFVYATYGPVLDAARLLSIQLRRGCMLKHNYRAALALLLDSCQKPDALCELRRFGQIIRRRVALFRKTINTWKHDQSVSIGTKVAGATVTPPSDSSNLFHQPPMHQSCKGGAARTQMLPLASVQDYINGDPSEIPVDARVVYKAHVNSIELLNYDEGSYIQTTIPLHILFGLISKKNALAVAKIHGIAGSARLTSIQLADAARSHHCSQCNTHYTVFSVVMSAKELNSTRTKTRRSVDKAKEDGLPHPLSQGLSDTILHKACQRMRPESFEEGGCAVCGQLKPLCQLSKLKAIKNMLHILDAPGVTRVERKSLKETVKAYKGPVLDYTCTHVCDECRVLLRKGTVPNNALANNLWIGSIPDELKGLSYVEKMLIAKVRHTCAYIKVASGMRKMKANIVAFEAPIAKIYTMLPPPRKEMDDVLAILFTGPCKPTAEDFKRTPVLVRRNRVIRALEWLKLNHGDYDDIQISQDNMAEYPEDSPPVSVEYRERETNKVAEGTSVFDQDDEDGTEEGECPYTVHGLTGEALDNMLPDQIKARALRHLNGSCKMLAVGHSATPESMYNNPQLYPQMFPWLFPYGLGGIGGSKLSEKRHKKHLLMYHDKRFQTDIDFPFVAFSHAQTKTSTSQGFLLVEQSRFNEISQRLMTANWTVMDSLTKRLESGEYVKPGTPDEEQCFQIIRDLDAISGKMHGSPASKKNMRSEIWSLIGRLGAPYWYITLSPADNRHPISIYMAGSDEKFNPIPLPYAQKVRLICSNPVAGARFFHFMVQTLLQDALGFQESHKGAFGETSGYYGTVEQQGRLTLHLHMLLWVKGTLSPQEMRDKILSSDSVWQQKLIDWLESCHSGDFITGTHAEVNEGNSKRSATKGYVDPTETLPVSPPPLCQNNHPNDADELCEACKKHSEWKRNFDETVDDLLLRSNVHNCRRALNKDGSRRKTMASSGCMDNKWGRCKARFPRDLHLKTYIDDMGAVIMKKAEPWINTFSHLLTYIFRCNTDVTSLASGTAIKAVVMYVSDYITKATLKTHTIFDSIRAVFHKNSEMIGGTLPMKEKARRFMTKVVNLLSAKAEMGSPMICMYLLGNPDHYTSHKFIDFYWQNYVAQVRNEFEPSEKPETQKVALLKRRGRILGVSKVQDYVHRPAELEDISLYEFIRCYKRIKFGSKEQGEENDDQEPFKCDEVVGADRSFAQEESNDADRYFAQGESSNAEKSFVEECSFEEQSFIDQGPDSTTNAANQASVLLLNNKRVDGDTAKPFNNESIKNKVQSDAENTSPSKLTSPGKLPKGTFHFTSGHPLSGSHGIRSYETTSHNVPNFTGNTLPREDKGDREYYCCTMLTLFQPWRKGTDLKKEGPYTWDESFLAHTFRDEDKILMKNLNIRYECMDARDDYRAQMKKGAVPNLFSSWDATVDDGEELDRDDARVDVQNAGDDLDAGAFESGKLHLRKLKEMETVRTMLGMIGWTDPNVPIADLKVAMEPTMIMTGSQWESQVEKSKQDILQRKNEYNKSTGEKPQEQTESPLFFTPNIVKVVDNTYLQRSFHREIHSELVSTTVDQYSLNSGQERAFRIISNHAICENAEQLRMYLGGMGGTGKSQVLKALASFFTARNEAHRFVVVAPTGTAAALLGGSTYHSMFGIHDRMSDKRLGAIKAKMQGVDYVFFDEVSMLSARDLCRIHGQLTKVLGNGELPFGGLNMVFSGDFAQLPPAIGGEKVALYSRVIGATASDRKSQDEAIGKALWHQITTVVILRENMRQRQQSEWDRKLRTALENMRYKACTPDDIAFLRTKVSSSAPGRTSICSQQFRNVSIITGTNLHKDEINRLGAIRFAHETGQSLVDFFSEDSEKVNPSNAAGKGVRHLNIITDEIQTLLWNQPPSFTDKHIPGKLSLCLGMPVMIRYNYATELCMTRGQEGFVIGWQGKIGQRQQQILDVIFVELKEPPAKIQINGLPENVVPIYPTINTINTMLPNGDRFYVERRQVELLINFAMTDFASQGKTRPYNVADLHNLSNHQAYYTALSRSASAAGTLILQGFDPRKITGGCSGALRQEFRELELLDSCTELKFESKLHEKVFGSTRNELIRNFRQWKGSHFVPKAVHQAIRWSKRDPLEASEILSNLASFNDIGSHKKALVKKSDPIVELKRKRRKSSDQVAEAEDSRSAQKVARKKKIYPAAGNFVNSLIPSAFKWQYNSCAYDSLFSILLWVWRTNKSQWAIEFGAIDNAHLRALIANFELHSAEKCTLEEARDVVRIMLHKADRRLQFSKYVSLDCLLQYMMSSPKVNGRTYYVCPQNHETVGSDITHLYRVATMGGHHDSSTAGWLASDQAGILTKQTCDRCNGYLVQKIKYVEAPAFVGLDWGVKDMRIDQNIVIPVDGVQHSYDLKGVIYFGGSHFVSVIVTEGKQAWLYDGMESNGDMTYVGSLDRSSLNLQEQGGRRACAAFYFRTDLLNI